MDGGGGKRRRFSEDDKDEPAFDLEPTDGKFA
jgi:hypothetical protein